MEFGLYWMVCLIIAAPSINGWIGNASMRILKATRRGPILLRKVSIIISLNFMRTDGLIILPMMDGGDMILSRN